MFVKDLMTAQIVHFLKSWMAMSFFARMEASPAYRFVGVSGHQGEWKDMRSLSCDPAIG
jgi:hypothetical protein